MLRTLFPLLLLINVIGCSPAEQQNVSDIAPDSVIRTATDPIQKQNTPSIVEAFETPSAFFLAATTYLGSCGFTPDTVRALKVGYYNRWTKNSKIFLIRKTPFFKEDFESNAAFKFTDHYNENTAADSLKILLASYKEDFYKVKNITGFYFRDKTSPSLNFGNLTSDGYLEEWEFKNAKDAEKAEAGLKDIQWEVYINSIILISRKDKYLYTLFSRSDWDAKRLEKIYKEIIKRSTEQN
ncbi:MAG TPA: hypothetical protein VGC65_11170 [Bacteroidia bacterium]|jgi:hypothetical protein